jgi:uncharacterized protein (DUF1697 family)
MAQTSDNSIKYIALLRGINVGGNKIIKMQDLKKVFEDLEFKNVKSVLATGNIIFETSKQTPKTLEDTIEQALENEFKTNISVIIKNIDEINKLINSNPFKNIKIDKNTRLYVTFVKNTISSKLKLPYKSPNLDYTILNIVDNIVFSVLQLSENTKTTKSMLILEKEFGKQITTRNWNTVLKLVK